jgi:DNA-binding GntR family transcriptional regulator
MTLRKPPQPAVKSKELPLGMTAKSLPDLVAERLLELIMTGQIEPGTRLKEIALAQEHAVSRATIREALTNLEKRRIVERIPRVGAHVTAVGKDEFLEIFEIRAVLLGLAAHRMARTAPDAEISELNSLVISMEALASQSSTSPRTFLRHSVGAQQFVIRSSASRWIVELYEQLSNLSSWRIIRGKAVSFVTPERRSESAADWRGIVDAIRMRDPDTADTKARTLLMHSAEATRVHLRSEAR